MFLLDIKLQDGTRRRKLKLNSFAEAEICAMAARLWFVDARLVIDELDDGGRLLRGYVYVENRSSVTGGEWQLYFDSHDQVEQSAAHEQAASDRRTP